MLPSSANDQRMSLRFPDVLQLCRIKREVAVETKSHCRPRRRRLHFHGYAADLAEEDGVGAGILIVQRVFQPGDEEQRMTAGRPLVVPARVKGWLLSFVNPEADLGLCRVIIICHVSRAVVIRADLEIRFIA